MENNLQIVPPNEVVTDKRIIDMINIDELEAVMDRINKFQQIVRKTLKQNLDYGIIPNTKKPTLLKPGAEKILILLGIRSEFDIIDKTRDFENGFFQYQVKCKLYKGEILITEGIGTCNTKEKKYKYADCYSSDNTVLKMSKKRALVDAALMVGSLSDIFTQDLEDMDLNGANVTDQNQEPIYTDQDGVINKNMAKQLFALAQRNNELVANIIKKYGYEKTTDIEKIDYAKICKDIQSVVDTKDEIK